MSQGGIVKKVTTDSHGNKVHTFEVSYTIEGGGMPPDFNPLALL